MLLTWRLAGVDRAAADASLPFLIEWGPGTPLPGAVATQDRAGSTVDLRQLVVDGDDGALRSVPRRGATESPVCCSTSTVP